MTSIKFPSEGGKVVRIDLNTVQGVSVKERYEEELPIYQIVVNTSRGNWSKVYRTMLAVENAVEVFVEAGFVVDYDLDEDIPMLDDFDVFSEFPIGTELDEDFINDVVEHGITIVGFDLTEPKPSSIIIDTNKDDTFQDGGDSDVL